MNKRESIFLIKRAFSLIELLIVIVIIGVVYTLAINNFEKVKDESKTLTIANLKEYLQSLTYEEKVELLCLDDCKECKIIVDDRVHKKLDGFLDKNIKSYRYDFSYGMVEIEKQNDICFSYAIDKNGVGEQVIVEYKNLFYDFTNYLYSVNTYESLEEVQDKKETLIQEVLR